MDNDIGNKMDNNIVKNKSETVNLSFSIWDINSIIEYIKNHYVKILLLILVIVIIYVVDHITNINAAIYGVQQVVPGLATQTTNNMANNKVKTKTKSKSKNKK
jgi:hypothetical protein